MSLPKGPWRVIRRAAASDNSRGFDIVGPAGPIAYVFPLDPGGIEGRANADLMAAAPLMLEALENLENDDGLRMPDSAWELVQQAVEAATGRRKPSAAEMRGEL